MITAPETVNPEPAPNKVMHHLALAAATLPARADHLAWLARLGMALAGVQQLSNALETAAAQLTALPLLARGYIIITEHNSLNACRVISFGQAPALRRDQSLEGGLCAHTLAYGHFAAVHMRAQPAVAWERALAVGAPLLCVSFSFAKGRGIILGARTDDPTEDAEAGACLQAAAEVIGATIGRTADCDAQNERHIVVTEQIHAERLAMVGRLTAALAHEINNPLQAISSSLDLLLTRPLPEEKRQRYLAMAHDEVEHVITTVRRMLDLHRSSEHGMRPVMLRSILEQALTQAGAILRQRAIQVRRELADDNLSVPAIASHLRHACYNLVLNAAHAMPDGGTLTVRMYRLTGENAEPRVVVEFVDTGASIADADLPHLFEPYGPTRGDSNGIELPLGYSIVEQHRGTLTARSSGGETIFQMNLPTYL